MGKQLQFIVNTMCLVLILVGIQNCAPFEPTGLINNGGQGSASSADLAAADSFSKTLQPTLLNNCASCHDGNTLGATAFSVPSAFSGSQAILTNGLVSMVTPSSSILIAKLEAGHNGISAAVTSEVAIGVQAWVDEMNKDVTAPTVRISSPTGGSMVSGTLMVTATATDAVGVVGVQFMIDGVDAGTEDTSEPFTASIDTLALANRAYKLTARARDAADNATLSAAVTVTVNNLTPDVTPPVVGIGTPAAGATVVGIISATATATDDVKVAGVQFYVDGVMNGAEDLVAPYSTSIDTKTLTNGPHIITARARDTSDNMTTSADRTVNVNNVANPNASFAWISTNILVPRCTVCHGAAKADAGVRYDTYLETIKTAKAGNLAGSTLYTEVNSGSMPIGGAKLTAVQIKAIADWITAGALNN